MATGRRGVGLGGLIVLAGALAGCGSLLPAEGHVGGVLVGTYGSQFTIFPGGHVSSFSVAPPGDRRTVVSPDGQWQAVVTLPRGSGTLATVALARVEPGSPERIVARDLFAGQAQLRWSPDSRSLAMVTRQAGRTTAVAVGIDGTRHVLAAPFCSGDGAQDGLAWSPDGERIALRVGTSASCDLVVRTVRSGAREVVAHGITGAPSWSADGRWIATSGSPAEVMRSDGSGRRRLGAGSVVWSPMGDTLAVVGAGSLRVGAPTELQRVTGGIETGPLPSFTAEGGRFAYVQDADTLVVRHTDDLSVAQRVDLDGVSVDLLGWRGSSLVVDARAHGD